MKMGPDGAIYIADWYNPIIQHGEVDFRDPRRDHTHGRIWRITAKGRPPSYSPQDSRASRTAELLELLEQLPEEWHAAAGQARAEELGGREVASRALRAIRWGSIKNDPELRAQSARSSLGLSNVERRNSACSASCSHRRDHACARRRSRVASERRRQRRMRPCSTQARGPHDEHPRVRLEAVRALPATNGRCRGHRCATALDKPMDRFLDFALWQTMRDLAPQWLPALQEGKLDFGGNVERSTFAPQGRRIARRGRAAAQNREGDSFPPERLQEHALAGRRARRAGRTGVGARFVLER